MLAERIYSLRKQRGLSQEQLAEALGVSRQTVSKWERGAAAPELERLRAMAEFFGVSLDELAGGEPRAPAMERCTGWLGVALCLLGAAALLVLGAVLLFAPERAEALDAASAVTLSGSGIALGLCVLVMAAGLWLTLRKK